MSETVEHASVCYNTSMLLPLLAFAPEVNLILELLPNLKEPVAPRPPVVMKGSEYRNRDVPRQSWATTRHARIRNDPQNMPMMLEQTPGQCDRSDTPS